MLRRRGRPCYMCWTRLKQEWFAAVASLAVSCHAYESSPVDSNAKKLLRLRNKRRRERLAEEYVQKHVRTISTYRCHNCSLPVAPTPRWQTQHLRHLPTNVQCIDTQGICNDSEIQRSMLARKWDNGHERTIAWSRFERDNYFPKISKCRFAHWQNVEVAFQISFSNFWIRLVLSVGYFRKMFNS